MCAELACVDGVVSSHQAVVGRASRFLRDLLTREGSGCRAREQVRFVSDIS